MKKKKKQKNTAVNIQLPSTREVASISKHEDVALKVTAQFFKDELMPMLNIEGNVVSVLPTEEIHLELKKGFEDFNYLMEDNTIKHFEFQSTNEGIAGLKRFRVYEAQLSLRHNKAVTTYVLFSGVIKNPMTEYTEGVNTYRIVPIIMQNKNADIVIAELKQKVNTGVEIAFYNLRQRDLDEILPWDFINIGVSKNFLKREWENALAGKVTPNCHQKCSGCGAAIYGGGVCFEGKN